MNPWELILAVLGWSVLSIIVIVMLMIVYAMFAAMVKLVFPKRRGRAKQIYSSGPE